MEDWADNIEARLRANGMSKVRCPRCSRPPPPSSRSSTKGIYASKLASYGVIVSYICPLMYMNNPLCKKKAVITCSNKLRTYTSARFYKKMRSLISSPQRRAEK